MDSLYNSTVYNTYYVKTDQACPKVTRDLNNASVVDSQYNQCQSCKNRESLQSRLNGKNKSYSTAHKYPNKNTGHHDKKSTPC